MKTNPRLCGFLLLEKVARKKLPNRPNDNGEKLCNQQQYRAHCKKG